MQKREGTEKENGGFLLVWKTKILKGELHGLAHACILTARFLAQAQVFHCLWTNREQVT